MVHVLLVNLKFSSHEDREEWKGIWAELAARVKAEEPNCLTYVLSDSVEDDSVAIIYERYTTRGDLDNKHQETLKSFDLSSRWKALGKADPEATLTRYQCPRHYLFSSQP